ncbi:MAG: VWA domain-containing protein [bacterium]
MSKLSAADRRGMYEELDEMFLNIRRRRVQVGLVALVVSCGVHVILAVLFPDLVYVRFLRTPKEPKRAFVVGDIKPLVPEQRVVTTKEKASPAVDLPLDASKAPGKVDRALLEPRVAPAATGEPGAQGIGKEKESSLAEPSWRPQPDALMVTRTVVDESQARLRPRRYVPTSPRVPDAGDYTADRADAVMSGAAAGSMGGGFGFNQVDLGRPPVGDGVGSLLVPVSVEPEGGVAGGGGGESIQKRLERLLTVEARKYVPASGQYAYCVINVRRIGEEMLPLLPKDILLVQDCSASMTEQRLYFCREGWTNSLSLLRPGDRFNVVRFRDHTERCFPDWTTPAPETLARAMEFIDGMKAEGDTDVYASLRALLDEKRTAGRPTVALVVSDGLPTVGERDSSNIIEEFSRANDGAVSVFAMGTTREANAFLLDLLGYRNRGDAYVVSGGRWEIPIAIEGRMRGISRPVLTDVRVAFSAASRCEAFPELSGNLYLDRALVIFCRFPKNLDQLVFQVTGRAGETECDMVFKVNLAATESEREILRTRWGLQKIYNLMGEYTRTRDPKLLKERQSLAREYGLKVPYPVDLSE